MSGRASVPALEPVKMSTQLVEEIVGGLEIVPLGRLDEHHARALDERIRLTAGTVRDRMTRLADLVEQAKAGEVWDVLGYASWTAYLADALGGQMHLPAAERRELVGMLSGEGMSTRAMAPIVGASPKTVARDVATLDLPGVSGDTPTVVGLDGNTYAPKRGKRATFTGEHVMTRSAEPIDWPESLDYLPKDIYAWVCSCGRDGSDEGWARRHVAENNGRIVIAGQERMPVYHLSQGEAAEALCHGATAGDTIGIDVYDITCAACLAAWRVRAPEQGTIEGTEPERMVPTLPGLGVSQQPAKPRDWFSAFSEWWGPHRVSSGTTKRVEVAEDAFRAGWEAARASS